ncbi:MAG: Nif3-like dinuclear metal center hexameric protein [Ruminococcus sp.]|nr:Nif3-like dinuclear metal center hexameric protein [Ruminococcus sp.]
MTFIKDIYEYLDTIVPFETQAEFDNCGLLVGDMDTKVSKVLMCLDITNEVIKEAKDISAQLILSHHPVIFSPLKSVQTDSVVYKLISSRLSALCAHTNLDKAENIGVNAVLAKKLNLKNTALYPDEFLCVGELSSPMTDREFALFVKNALSCKGVRYTKGKVVKTVAVSSGAGSEGVTLSDKYSFDAFVTGELKHHHFLYAKEKSLCAVEAGHFCTEDIVIGPLRDLLAGQFSDVTFVKSQTLTDMVEFA